MSSYQFKTTILVLMALVSQIIISIVPEISSHRPVIFENSYRYFRYFYLIGGVLPAMLFIAPILCFSSHKKINQIIKFGFIIGFIIYIIHGEFFYSDTFLKEVFSNICVAIIYTNIIILLYKAILRVKNKLLIIGVFCSFFPLSKLVMLLTELVLVKDPVLRGEIIIYSSSILFLILLLIYYFITIKEPKEIGVSYKNFSIRIFVYLINILKEYSIIKLFIYLLICGVISGFIQQYILHDLSFSNKQDLNYFFFFQVIIYPILFILIILVSAYVTKEKFNLIFFCSSILLFLNILLILIFGNSSILRELLIVNYNWYCPFLFFLIITKYIAKNKYHRFNIILSLGYVTFLFGTISSEWINIWFNSNYIVLILLLFIIPLVNIKLRKPVLSY
ncbi:MULTISPECIES: hypothetical protein [unclassified Francisella]|uniref:hypothetical protein n=1 Tax=unclassified Francisella TaxID=2610885 RepID=UPI002E311FAF|nr:MULTISPECIES: hypothetical protein [unclassified Francisella]MED7818906.1 hypothetical protein [Francisella sp. 19S2-4]MED7829743.1 hypothetical protein [Francisella sp. 19S2-10]